MMIALCYLLLAQSTATTGSHTYLFCSTPRGGRRHNGQRTFLAVQATHAPDRAHRPQRAVRAGQRSARRETWAQVQAVVLSEHEKEKRRRPVCRRCPRWLARAPSTRSRLPHGLVRSARCHLFKHLVRIVLHPLAGPPCQADICFPLRARLLRPARRLLGLDRQLRSPSAGGRGRPRSACAPGRLSVESKADVPECAVARQEDGRTRSQEGIPRRRTAV